MALAMLVALVSNGTPVWLELRRGHADRADLLWLVTLLALALALVALSATLLRRQAAVAIGAGAPPLGRALLRAAAPAVVALAVLALLAIARLELDGTGLAGPLRYWNPLGGPRGLWNITDDRNTGVMAGEAEDAVEQPGLTGEATGTLPLVVVLPIVVLLALAALALWRWQAHRSAQPSDADGAAADEHTAVHGAVLRTIDSMLADPDPNTAVIGAYARLLENLDACGIGRLPHEGPVEHLQRALAGVQARPAPLRELITLFEIARFSSHALTNAHREQALRALRAVAADIESAAVEAPTHMRSELARR